MKTHLRVLLVVTSCIVTVQAVLAFTIYRSLPNWEARGSFGDSFGLVNALFSGLAFAGLIYAILLQREDLALQRAELELTRQELKRTASAQEQAEISLRAQAKAAAQSASLAATNFLLDHYSSELSSLSKSAYPKTDPRYERQLELQRRDAILKTNLDALFGQIANLQRDGDAT